MLKGVIPAGIVKVPRMLTSTTLLHDGLECGALSSDSCGHVITGLCMEVWVSSKNYFSQVLAGLTTLDLCSLFLSSEWQIGMQALCTASWRDKAGP